MNFEEKKWQRSGTRTIPIKNKKKRMKNENNEDIIGKIKKGAIGVLRTDTVYGVVCSAFCEEAIEKMYTICGRDDHKPFVVLVSNVGSLARFGVKLCESAKEVIGSVWPGKVSIVIDCESSHFRFLHRGRKSVAFRLPEDEKLREIIEKTGPLATTSANPQGEKTAQTVEEARNYFGDNIDFYVKGGKCEFLPSTIIKIGKGKVELIRNGDVPVDVSKFNK